MADLLITLLDDLAVLAVRGPDAAAFLQGQLSSDVDQLEATPAQAAGLHNPQGRCLAVLRLLRVDQDQVLVILPAELATTVVAHLSKYVLRARVRIDNVSGQWRAYGAAGPDAEAAASTRLAAPLDASGLRQLIVAPRPEPPPDGDLQPREAWTQEDIAAGQPQVVAATSGAFTAQMLNLDLVGAVSFSKGCYTGQEIIARAHYLGHAKRRMQRFFTAAWQPLQPGMRILLADGRRAQVVMACETENGGQEFLAVTTLVSSLGQALVDEADAVGAADRTSAEQLALPYPLS
jgi:tRNA-modifying protein YgfZ